MGLGEMIEIVEYAFAVVLLPILAFGGLAMVQRKPQEAVFGRRSGLRPRLPILYSLSYACFIVSAVILVKREGVEFTVLLWPLSLTLGAIIVSMLLAYAPLALKPIVRPFMTSPEMMER